MPPPKPRSSWTKFTRSSVKKWTDNGLCYPLERRWKISCSSWERSSSSGTLTHPNSGMISRYSSYTWIHIWIHRSWNVTYEFMIMKSYMNSWYEFRYEFMIMKNIVNSYVRIHMYEFTSEFMLVNSWSWNHIWIHMYEFMCEFSAMNNIVKSWLNFWKWIHIWNHGWIH